MNKKQTTEKLMDILYEHIADEVRRDFARKLVKELEREEKEVAEAFSDQDDKTRMEWFHFTQGIGRAVQYIEDNYLLYGSDEG